MKYVVESYDEDSESWDLVAEIPPCDSRAVAESEARHWRSLLSGYARTRIVELP